MLVFFTSSVYAGSCPKMVAKIDGKIKKAQELRDDGMKAHELGDHAKSEKLLKQALALFKKSIYFLPCMNKTFPRTIFLTL